MRVLFAALALAGVLTAGPAAPASAGRLRAQAQWGGPDFPFSCETVRSYRAEIESMSRATKVALARQFRITRKQRRQAEACLRDRPERGP
jgi:hypothetical protein